MSRQYRIVNDTTMALVEDIVTKLSDQHRGFQVHGGVEWNGTNYIVLVSFEVKGEVEGVNEEPCRIQQ